MKENHWRLLCDRCCHGEQGCVSWGDAEPVLAGEQTGKHGEMAPAGSCAAGFAVGAVAWDAEEPVISPGLGLWGRSSLQLIIYSYPGY